MPEYKVYRTRRRPLGGRSASSDLENLRRRLGRRRDREPREPGEGITLGRFLKWVAVAIAAWLLLSLLLFLVSAQVEQGVSADAKNALSGGGSLLTGSNVVVHTAFGSVRKLSIPRDAYAEIPGHNAQKINAAYALGGAPLMIDTVEQYLGNGLKINHIIEVDFKDFPKLIDALGGVTVHNKTKICAPPFDNFWKGFNLPKGE